MLAIGNAGNRLMQTADSHTQHTDIQGHSPQSTQSQDRCLYMQMKFAAAHQE